MERVQFSEKLDIDEGKKIAIASYNLNESTNGLRSSSRPRPAVKIPIYDRSEEFEIAVPQRWWLLIIIISLFFNIKKTP